MKNISLILNVVLLVAVAFLYVKVYSGDTDEVKVTGPAATSKIVYVNSDSLMDNYSLFKQIQDNMEKKRDSLDKIFTTRGESLQREIQSYQENGGSMSPQERAQKEEMLTRKQQAYVADRDAVMEKLSNEEKVMTDSLHNDLVAYLKKFNKDKHYDFIMGYTRGAGILLANDSLDITKVIIKGINSN